jgi:hypothetical protein
MSELKNSKDWPQVYSCKFLEAGIVSYEDSDSGIALLKKETIDKMAPSFIGRPVLINHKKVGPGNFKEHAVGYVINVRFNPDDAWYYSDFIVTDDEARDLIENKKYSVSCAYEVLDTKEGGLWHDINYDGEITNGSFTHLALVDAPRYEDSKITKQLPAMLVNGKAAHYIQTKEEDSMDFNIFKKKADGQNEKIDPLILINGKEVKLAAVLESLIEKINEKKGGTLEDGSEDEMVGIEAKADKNDLIDVNGHSYKIADIKKNCVAVEKKNESEKAEMKKASDEDEKKEQNAKKNEKEKEEEEKKNDEEKEKLEKEELMKKNEKEEKEKKEKENAKKKEGEEFFNSLDALSKAVNFDQVPAPLPTTRQERANKKREQIAKQFA